MEHSIKFAELFIHMDISLVIHGSYFG